jgi:hypothetical protein
MEVEAMFETLTALKNRVLRGTPQPPHDEVDHLHWDREAREWRRHDSSDEQRAA